MFDSHRTGVQAEAALFEKAANGATPERTLMEVEKDGQHSPRDWSADGRTLVLAKSGPPNGLWNVWNLPLSADMKPMPYRTGRFTENEAVLSPNMQWLAFTTNESGRDDVVVQPWPDPSAWRELCFIDARGRLTAVAVNTQGTSAIQQSTVLMQTPVPLPLGQSGAESAYDAARNGQRFLMLVPQGRASSIPLTARLNWAR